MKPSKPVVFRPKSREFQFEVCCVAQQFGLEQESVYEPFYWKDTKSKRRFRYLELCDELEVSDDDFDRWANSVLHRIRMPMTDVKFGEAIDILRQMPVPKGDRHAEY
jgi:hypothetical protein